MREFINTVLILLLLLLFLFFVVVIVVGASDVGVSASSVALSVVVVTFMNIKKRMRRMTMMPLFYSSCLFLDLHSFLLRVSFSASSSSAFSYCDA